VYVCVCVCIWCIYVYIYIYVRVCIYMCVCVKVWEIDEKKHKSGLVVHTYGWPLKSGVCMCVVCDMCASVMYVTYYACDV